MTHPAQPPITPENVRRIMQAIDAYRTNQPLLAQTVLAQMGTAALPTAMFVLIGAMDAVDLIDVDDEDDESDPR